MTLDISLGAANALVNVLVYMATAMIGQLIEKTYARLACVQLRKTGVTDATDCNEVHFLNRLFQFSMTRRRERGHARWWVIMLMLLLFCLLPAELLLEAGLIERHDCTPREKKSMGVCASPWRGDRNVFVSSAMLMTQRAGWIDDKTGKAWIDIVEGMRKAPRVSEVHRSARHLEQRLVLGSCIVHTSSCYTEDVCGTLSVARTNSPYSTVVTNASIFTERSDCGGDVTFDGHLAVGFYFCPEEKSTSAIRSSPRMNRSVEVTDLGSFESRGRHLPPTQPGTLLNSDGRKEIMALGIETILDHNQLVRAKLGSEEPWNISTSLYRSRLYSIRCETDGLLASDLAKAVQLYRTTQFEQPGVRQDHVGENISQLAPLSATDVLKAGFSLKAEDNSESCEGTVQVYTACGDFKLMLVLPFITMSLFLVFLWLYCKVRLETGDYFVPFDCPTWRTIAHNQAMVLRSLRQPDEEVGTKLSDTMDNGVTWYTESKFDSSNPELVPGAVTTKTFNLHKAPQV